MAKVYNKLLLETGDIMLLETGDEFLLESYYWENLVAVTAIFTLTGNNVMLKYGKILTTEVSNFALTGINVLLRRPMRYLTVAVANFTLTGNGIGILEP